MKTISIALKDMQILFKDRGTLFQLFILPLIFILVFSGALGAIAQGNEAEVTLPNLGVVDLDSGEAAAFLLREITQDGSLAVQTYSAADAQSQLDENKVVAILTIPSGFTGGVQQSTPVTLVITTGTNADPQVVEAIRLVVESIAADMTLESQIIASLTQMGEMQATAPQEYQVFSTERVLAQARTQFETAQARPLINIVQSVPLQEADKEETPDLSLSAVPGFTILFVFMAGQTTARSIFEEKKVGSFRRLAAAPINKAQLLIGKILPNFVIALIQIVVIFAFGAFGLRLMGLTPLPIERAPLGAVLVAILLALCSSAFGILIASLARTENQISGLSTLLLWGMGLLGGCLVPLFILERFIGPLAMIVPHYWANKALDDLLIRGLSLADVYLSLVMLGVFSLIFFVIGLWRFDFER
jgi:ABC-2 type transport system permease protein